MSTARPILHLEVQLLPSASVRSDVIVDYVSKWIIRQFKVLRKGQCIYRFGTYKANFVSAANILSLDCTQLHQFAKLLRVGECNGREDVQSFRLEEVELEYHVYKLHESGKEFE
jgi:hypothetical protein